MTVAPRDAAPPEAPAARPASPTEIFLAFNRLARMMSDDKIVNSDTAGTMMAGKARAMDIMTNPSNPLHGKYASGDKTTADLVSDLLKNG